MNKILQIVSAGILLVMMSLSQTAISHASLAPTLNQTINAGALTASINQAGDVTPVSSPAVTFSPVNYSFQCQTTTGTLGDTNNLINVTNLASGVTSWNIAIAPTGGTTATWTSGSNTYAFNNTAGSGCTSGDLTINPAAGTITMDCNSNCSANNATVTLGSSATYNGSTVTSATLMSDSAGTAWEGYLMGVSLSQSVPALTPAGAYSLPMTITLTHS